MSKYEVKLVNIGEEVDNRIRELEIEVKDIRKANDNLTRANESYRQENIDLRKEQFGVEVAMLTKKVDDLKKRNDFFEKLFSQHRYVFSEIPNTEENLKMVKLMKKHINKKRYNLSWRGQYLIDGEDWRSYTYGQPLSKSKCIRVYIDSIANNVSSIEGFTANEVDTIMDALNCWEDKLSVDFYKSDTVTQLLNYFESMRLHLENSASTPIKDNVNIVIPKGDKQCHTK